MSLPSKVLPKQRRARRYRKFFSQSTKESNRWSEFISKLCWAILKLSTWNEENISNYYSWLVIMVNNLWRNREKMEDVWDMEKLLWSLTPKFEHMVAVIEESKNLKEISIEKLLGSLKFMSNAWKRKLFSKCGTSIRIKADSKWSRSWSWPWLW